MKYSKQTSIVILLAIDISFFLLEASSGIRSGSLALIADSLHMLNDIASLIVALWAVRLVNSKSATPKYSYGWQRAEILGALINGVFLLALCLSILLEAVQRLISPPNVTNPRLIVIVGILGMISNVVGLTLFHEHSHGGHAHSHSHESDHEHDDDEHTGLLAHYPEEPDVHIFPATARAAVLETAQHLDHSHDHEHEHGHENDHQHDHSHVDPEAQANKKRKHDHGGSMNMKGVYLHVLGDLLGNIGVVAAGLVIWLTEWKYKFYFDPAVSLVLTCIIFHSALPLVKSASFILLQGVPINVDLASTQAAIEAIPGVIAQHDLHIWSLSESKSVASLHVTMRDESDLQRVSTQIRAILHARGVHSSTIQPEFSDSHRQSSHPSICLDRCGDDCAADTCCPPESGENASSNATVTAGSNQA